MLAADGAASFSAKEGVKGKGGKEFARGGGGAQGGGRGGGAGVVLCGRGEGGASGGGGGVAAAGGSGRLVHIAFSIKMQGCVVDGIGAARVCRGVVDGTWAARSAGVWWMAWGQQGCAGGVAAGTHTEARLSSSTSSPSCSCSC